jgi:hypothetical protein
MISEGCSPRAAPMIPTSGIRTPRVEIDVGGPLLALIPASGLSIRPYNKDVVQQICRTADLLCGAGGALAEKLPAIRIGGCISEHPEGVPLGVEHEPSAIRRTRR